MAAENVIHKPELHKQRADLVVVGGGPSGMYLINELCRRNGSGFKPLLLEQADVLGGSGSASMQQLRTFQSNQTMVDMIARTRQWYDGIGIENGQKLINQLPYLFVSNEDAQLKQYDRILREIQQWGYGQNGEILSPEELRRQFSFIDGEIAGALLYPEAYQLDFEAACHHITRGAPRATFALGTTMADIKIVDGKVVGVNTSQGFVETDTVVLATGPFVIKTGDRILGGRIEEGAMLSKLVEVRKRQRFSATVHDLPPYTKVFVIAPGGQYVRLHTNNEGKGSGDYGFADPGDPLVSEPLVNPQIDEVEFPATVYYGLGQVISRYGDDNRSGPLALQPIRGSRVAGYYAETSDDLPILCKTQIPGLFLTVAHSHVGVMSGIGAAERMADIIEKGEPEDNPFKLNRDFKGNGIRL